MTIASLLANVDFPTASAPFQERLRHLCEATLEIEADPDQMLRLAVHAASGCPERLVDPILRAAHELVSNAVKHGMYARSVGQITVRLGSVAGMTLLAVTDDGWGFRAPVVLGDGLTLVTAMAKRHGGAFSLQRQSGLTVAAASLRA